MYWFGASLFLAIVGFLESCRRTACDDWRLKTLLRENSRVLSAAQRHECLHESLVVADRLHSIRRELESFDEVASMQVAVWRAASRVLTFFFRRKVVVEDDVMLDRKRWLTPPDILGRSER